MGQKFKSAICVWNVNLVKIKYNNSFLSKMVSLTVDRDFSKYHKGAKKKSDHVIFVSIVYSLV